ncbi:hypothetical protein [uncultured Cellulomonas sp.]|uniref:hypothetical protein n=1 Tax=uncultured Cellulomonas sp. TaxID=189682 RepID=UPI0026138B29|nr:hypothetical protein [uncultured Cellulomonas sp.]
MTYRLEDLGPHEFEHLVQALLLKVYGPTVQVFGTGPDSGRDAVFEGRAVPADGEHHHAAPWDGYHVFQVKFREQLQSTAANKTWLLTQIRRELDKWAHPGTKRKGPKPEFIVFVTNVGLGGAVDGGLNEATRTIRSAARTHDWPLKDCAVWDRAKVERLLDGFADVRQQFNALITPGDVLAAINLGRMTGLGQRVEDIRRALEEHARTELITRGQINLGEAGQVANQKLDLAHVAVDLPARHPDDPDPLAHSFAALAHIVTAGERVLRPSVLAGADLQPHFLVTGGPGQGKTTLGRLLAQLYRATMLAERDGQSPPVQAAVADTLRRAEEIGIPRPRARRWPVRVDLAEYADLAGGGADLPLVRYLAERISASTGETFHARDMRGWLRAWPWLLVLDGYDEVAAKPARETVAAAVNQLLEQAHTEDADLLVVATTRPQGYSDELPTSFRKLELVPLSAQQAVDYASRLTELRMGEDAEKSAVLQRITDAAANELTRRLMRSPLQVMIMSLLLERRAKPPQDRAALFADYYDVIYDREVQKKNYLATVLSERRADVDAIHRATGLRLQVASESAGEAEALLSSQDFEMVIRDRLTKEGHKGAALERLAGDLLRAARDRLVLVTAKGKDQVGFELRSIQEFMAACALVDGLDNEVIGRLRVIAPSAHWRNTWLLAVGAVYRDRAPLFDPVLHMMRELDASDTFSLIIETAPRLAIDILDDGMASKSPKHLRLLVDLALQILTGPNLGAGRLGDVLAEVGDDESARLKIIAALQRAWDGSPSAHEAAALVLERLTAPDQQGVLPARARQMRATKPTTAPPTGPGTPGATVRLSDALPDDVRNWPRTSVEGRFVDEIRHVRTVVGPRGEFLVPEGITPGQAAAALLTYDDALGRVAEAIDAIEPYNWSARTAIVAFLWRARERVPVAHRLTP